MGKLYTEFEIYNDMSNGEYEFLKRKSIREIVERYITEIKINDKYGSIFNKKIALELHKERYFIGDKLIERIELEPISINTIEYNPKIEPYSMYKKYSFKDRLKILFTGRVNR